MTKPTNADRREKARRVLEVAAQIYEDDLAAEEFLIDLLTDLRHLCADPDVGIGFEHCVALSAIHFESEKNQQD